MNNRFNIVNLLTCFNLVFLYVISINIYRAKYTVTSRRWGLYKQPVPFRTFIFFAQEGFSYLCLWDAASKVGYIGMRQQYKTELLGSTHTANKSRGHLPVTSE